MNETDLEARLKAHFHKLNTQHKRRALAVGKPSNLSFEDLLATCQAFEWKCPFCDKSLADIEVWNYNHFNNIKNSGHVFGACVISCEMDNKRLWMEHKDNVEEFLLSIGKSPKEFYQKINKAIAKRAEQLQQELEEVTQQLEEVEPTLFEQSFLMLAEKLTQKSQAING